MTCDPSGTRVSTLLYEHIFHFLSTYFFNVLSQLAVPWTIQVERGGVERYKKDDFLCNLTAL